MTKIFRTKAAKLVFFVLFFGILYFQLRAKGDWQEMWVEFQAHLSQTSLTFLVAALALIFLNLFLETLKWQYLVSPFQKIGLKISIQAILSGMSLSLVTPARLGEFGGRMLGLEPTNRSKGIWALAFGSYIQTVIIFWLGWLALWKHPNWIANDFLLPNSLLSYLFVVGVGLFLVAIFHDWLISNIVRKGTRIGGWVHKGYFPFSLQQILVIAGLALLRIGVYTIQFYLLNIFFGLTEDFQTQLAIIFAIFLFQAFFPLPAMLGLLMKSEIALFLWASYGVNEISVLSGTFFLWIINVLLPGLIGLFYLKKIFKDKTKRHV